MTCPRKKKSEGQKELAVIQKISKLDVDLNVDIVVNYKYEKERVVRGILCMLIILDEGPFRSVEGEQTFQYVA